MNSDTPGSTARIAGYPILRTLAAFPIACFSGALATDIAYAGTADMLWADFSAWLLAVGMIMGGLATMVGIVDFVVDRTLRAHRALWPVMIGSLLVLILGLFNNFVHSRDAWTSVVPLGLELSAATVVVMLITIWFASATTYRRDVSMQYSGVRQ
ncbi:MAG: hypothetical protein QOH05_567 [Acetobacteraceae bacterium]|jgi:uncharacterized membrane protein|nr:hypothetical protein [Acetobacteraceae bacterium]